MILEAFSLRSSVFLVPAPEKQMPALPPHTEAAAAPALTPGEQRVPDHRSSLWEAIPVAGAAALSSARMSPLISGTVIEESFCGPQMPVSSSPHGQHELYPSGWAQRDMAGWGGVGARFSLRIASVGLSRGHRQFCPPSHSLLIAGSLSATAMGVSSLLSSFKPHTHSHSSRSLFLTPQPGRKPVLYSSPTFSSP